MGCPEGEADIMGGGEGEGVQEGREQREKGHKKQMRARVCLRMCFNTLPRSTTC